MSDSFPESPIIIIGAGRSGTNMLRDILTREPAFITWPCDEINYIWRHNHRGYETDQFTREMADEKTKKYIRQSFSSLAKKNTSATVVEKTCANSLRCGFIHEIFPAAKFIHIVRDGRDVAASAALRWNAKLDPAYLFSKARFVPKSDLFYYASRYFYARLYRVFSKQERLSTWGPKFEGMQTAFRDNDLPVGCAIQWRECVKAATLQLEKVPSDQVLTLRYETFTSNPCKELARVFEFANVSVEEARLHELTTGVSTKSVKKWKSQLADSEIAAIQDEAGSWLERLGYEL